MSKKIIFTIVLTIVLGVIFILKFSSRTFEIGGGNRPEYKIEDGKYQNSPISGLPCENSNHRPLAVVLAEDPVARPLAGLSEADLIFEMPVITGSITRMLAIYVCGSPKEIGSLRSARHDFIPLAMGLDAILVHWGGSHFALDKLDAGVMDNIDALINPFDAFYQKREIPQPHNGFTSMERLLNSAKKLGYRLENEFEGYPHEEISKSKIQISNQIQNPKSKKTLEISYSYPYNVKYQYKPETNSYLRWRTNKLEIDKNNSQQIEAKNIVVMRAFSRQIEGPDYNDLDIEGSGECQIYQNGAVIPCVWRKNKNTPKSKLYFLDENSQEIKFVPGQIWIEIIEPGQNIVWQ